MKTFFFSKKTLLIDGSKWNSGAFRKHPLIYISAKLRRWWLTRRRMKISKCQMVVPENFSLNLTLVHQRMGYKVSNSLSWNMALIETDFRLSCHLFSVAQRTNIPHRWTSSNYKEMEKQVFFWFVWHLCLYAHTWFNRSKNCVDYSLSFSAFFFFPYFTDKLIETRAWETKLSRFLYGILWIHKMYSHWVICIQKLY